LYETVVHSVNESRTIAIIMSTNVMLTWLMSGYNGHYYSRIAKMQFD